MSTPVPTIEVLRAARVLVANPKTWCRGMFAAKVESPESAWNDACSPRDPDAKCFCVLGALEHAGYKRGLSTSDLDPLREALNRITKRDTPYPFVVWANDDLFGGGRELVLQIIDAAIAELEGETHGQV